MPWDSESLIKKWNKFIFTIYHCIKQLYRKLHGNAGITLENKFALSLHVENEAVS